MVFVANFLIIIFDNSCTLSTISVLYYKLIICTLKFNILPTSCAPNTACAYDADYWFRLLALFMLQFMLHTILKLNQS